MTENEFIAAWNIATEDVVGNNFFSCWVVERVKWDKREYLLGKYNVFMGDKFLKQWGGYYCTMQGFDETDRILALELFYNICLTEKLYKEL